MAMQPAVQQSNDSDSSSVSGGPHHNATLDTAEAQKTGNLEDLYILPLPGRSGRRITNYNIFVKLEMLISSLTTKYCCSSYLKSTQEKLDLFLLC